MKLTKNKRHELYKKSLRLYKDGTDEHRAICYCLEDALRANGYQDDAITYARYNVISTWFPELMRLRPDNTRMFWWPTEDTKIRIKVLKQCVRETAPKKRIKK